MSLPGPIHINTSLNNWHCIATHSESNYTVYTDRSPESGFRARGVQDLKPTTPCHPERREGSPHGQESLSLAFCLDEIPSALPSSTFFNPDSSDPDVILR